MCFCRALVTWSPALPQSPLHRHIFTTLGSKDKVTLHYAIKSAALSIQCIVFDCFVFVYLDWRNPCRQFWIFKMLLWQLRNLEDCAKNYVSSLFYQNIQKRLTSQHKHPDDQPAQLEEEELPKCLSFRRLEMTSTSVLLPAINKLAVKNIISQLLLFLFRKILHIIT